MAGEVTERQQRQAPAENPPSFLNAGAYGLGREEAKVGLDISKICTSTPTDKTMGFPSKGASFWTKARRKATMSYR